MTIPQNILDEVKKVNPDLVNPSSWLYQYMKEQGILNFAIMNVYMNIHHPNDSILHQKGPNHEKTT